MNPAESELPLWNMYTSNIRFIAIILDRASGMIHKSLTDEVKTITFDCMYGLERWREWDKEDEL